MDAVGDVRFDGDSSATVFDVFGVFSVDCVLVNSEGCVVGEVGVVDEDCVWVNLAVCIIESKFFVMPLIYVALNDIHFVSVHVSVGK